MEAASRASHPIPRPALGLAALLFACAPAPALRYASADPADRWEAGVRWHPAEAGGLACSTSFGGDGYASVPGFGGGRTLDFGLILRNDAGASARIDPADFRLYAPRRGSVHAAADPESALADVDRRIGALDANHNAQAGIKLAGDLLYLAASVANLGDARAQAELNRTAAESDRNDREESGNYRGLLAALKEERRGWSDAHLRRTDLDPGSMMAGKLTFIFPQGLPPDTLVLQWAPAGGGSFDLGRYGRPRLPVDTLKPAPPRYIPQNGFQYP